MKSINYDRKSDYKNTIEQDAIILKSATGGEEI